MKLQFELDKRVAEIKRMHHEGNIESFHRTEVGGYLRDFVYGANDGIITTFAVVAGVAGADLSARIVVILGFANLLADGFSMAMSNYLGEKSNRDFIATERAREEWEVEKLPEEERQEIREMYRKKGFQGEILEKIVATITADKKLWVDEMMAGEHGLLPNHDTAHPWKNAVTTFFAFVVAGFVPLLPYFAGMSARETFPYAIAATALILFIVGSLRSFITGKRWYMAGIEMLIVGIVASAVAYMIGAFLSGIVH